MNRKADDVGQAVHDADGRLMEEQITAQQFETAWAAMFPFLISMPTDPWRRCSIIQNFGGSSVEIEF